MNPIRSHYPLYEHTPFMRLNCILCQRSQRKATPIKIEQSLLQNRFQNDAVGLPPEWNPLDTTTPSMYHYWTGNTARTCQNKPQGQRLCHSLPTTPVVLRRENCENYFASKIAIVRRPLTTHNSEWFIFEVNKFAFDYNFVSIESLK